MGMRARIMAGVGAAAAVLLLAGCVGGGAAAESAPPTASAAASAAPPSETAPAPEPSVEPLSTVATIVIRPEALELRDEAGEEVATLDYRLDAAAAVAAFETVFASAPVDEEYPGSSHFPPATAHRWGAFELWEFRYADRWSERAEEEPTLFRPEFRAVFTGEAEQGIALTTQSGIEAGLPWDELLAVPGLFVNPTGCSGPSLDYLETSSTAPDGVEYTHKVGVEFAADEGHTKIQWVRAPISLPEQGCA